MEKDIKVALRGAISTLFNGMLFTLGYKYRDMMCGIEHGGYSAPAWVCVIYAIPFLVAIGVCVIIARKYSKVNNKKKEDTIDDK